MRKPKNPTSLRCLRTAFLVPCITASLASTACNRARPFEMYRIKPKDNVEGNFVMVGATEENINRFFALKERLVTAKNRVGRVKLPELVKLASHAQINGKETEFTHIDGNINKVLLLERVTIKYAERIVELLEKNINTEYQLALLRQVIDIIEREIESIRPVA